jgi:murein L,D-transpeptidase YcbB/YkuD
MRAIVGRAERPTPIFSAGMNTIVVNPYWRVPKTILQEDIIPEMRKNIRYLKKERIRIFKQGDESGKRAINPASINWKKANADTFPYYLRQDAGAKNSLGRLKFLFPNSHDVYIHDTPYKNLFEKRTRSFSSGCIRIEEPVILANYLLENDGKDVDITALMRGRANKNIFFSNPVKVYLDYWTVWTEDNGTVHFREDIYGHDGELAEILGWNREPN